MCSLSVFLWAMFPGLLIMSMGTPMIKEGEKGNILFITEKIGLYHQADWACLACSL